MNTKELEGMWKAWQEAGGGQIRPGERVALAQAIALSRIADALAPLAEIAEIARREERAS